MAKAWPTWTAAGVLGAGAVASFMLGEPAPGVAMLGGAAAMAALAVPAKRIASVPIDVGQAGLAELVSALGLKGRGVYIPTKGAVRLWIPPEDLSEVPSAVGERVMLREQPGRTGIAIQPAGESLFQHISQSHELPTGGGAAGLKASVQQAFQLLALGDQVGVASDGTRWRVTFRHVDATTCTRAAALAPWHLQGSCPTCSLVACLAARAASRPVRLANQRLDARRCTLELEVL